MRKFLISLAVATVAVSAVPAAAQNHGARPDYGHGWQRGGPTRAQVNDLLRDLSRADQRIDRAPGISRREGASLHREANQIRFQLNRALRNGINAREFAVLRGQVNRLQLRVRVENRDRDNRRF